MARYISLTAATAGPGCRASARNAALCELAATLPAERRIQELRTLLERYATTAWRFDSGREEMPEHYRGAQREILWRAFKSGARLPLCERQLRNIVGGEPSRTREEPTAAGGGASNAPSPEPA